ncbi:PhzA/PhzB family protein [Streptomyces sp. NPDC000927]|uniref:PhzA/PhzB family protein n=1 Tax=Streptomyces sp. NPDC000927 TaxID=3154371 RepID=UPI00332C298E
MSASHTTTARAGDVPTDTDALRAHNRAIVDQYMNTRGQDRLRRHLLFTEDGVGGLWTTDTCEPITINGRDRLGEHAVWSLKCFPDWAWINIEIFDTQDPNRFWVECDGEGTIRFSGYPEGHYRNHFLHSFTFEGGKIKLQREFMNVCAQFRALGIQVPVVKRAGIPT